MGICKLRWIENFEVGIDELDADHHDMFDMMVEIRRSSLCGDRANISQQMQALLALAGAHFEREDRLLYQLDPLHALRTDDAAERLKEVRTLAADIEDAGAPMDLQDLPVRLADWFCRQTIGRDAAIRAHYHRAAVPALRRCKAAASANEA